MSEDAKLVCMAKKSQTVRGRPKNPDAVTEARLFVELDVRLKELLEQEAQREGRSLKSQLSRILTERFAAAGLWPPE